MSVSLRKQFNIGSWLDKYARQKKLALCMWYDIIVALQHEDFVRIEIRKQEFAKKHNLHWHNNCFLCHLFMRFDKNLILISCTECPLEKKYKGRVSFGCALEEGTVTPWARVTNCTLSKEERITAAWEIVEAIKSV